MQWITEEEWLYVDWQGDFPWNYSNTNYVAFDTYNDQLFNTDGRNKSPCICEKDVV